MNVSAIYEQNGTNSGTPFLVTTRWTKSGMNTLMGFKCGVLCRTKSQRALYNWKFGSGDVLRLPGGENHMGSLNWKVIAWNTALCNKHENIFSGIQDSFLSRILISILVLFQWENSVIKASNLASLKWRDLPASHIRTWFRLDGYSDFLIAEYSASDWACHRWGRQTFTLAKLLFEIWNWGPPIGLATDGA